MECIFTYAWILMGHPVDFTYKIEGIVIKYSEIYENSAKSVQ